MSDDLLRQAYEGEVLGEAFFGRLAERSDDTDHKAKLEVLCRLEASTKALLRPMIDASRIDVDEGAAARAAAKPRACDGGKVSSRHPRSAGSG